MKRGLLFLSVLLLVAVSWAQQVESLQSRAQQAFVAGNYLQAAKTYSEWASSTNDRKQKIEALYWESLSRYQAVERGEETQDRADSVLQRLLSTSEPGDSLYFAGQLLGAYMSLQRDPETARKRYEAAQLQPFRNLEPRNLFVGYLVYSKLKNKAKADKLKNRLIRQFPSSPEAQNLGSRVAQSTPQRKTTREASSSTPPMSSSSARMAKTEKTISSSSSERKAKALSSQSNRTATLSSSAAKTAKAKKPAEKAVEKVAANSSSETGFYLQLAAVAGSENAERFVEQARKKGVSRPMSVEESGGRHKVRIYGFATREAAQEYAEKNLKPKKLSFLVVKKTQ